MKKTQLLLILTMITLSSFLGPAESLTMDQINSLSDLKKTEFWKTVHRQVLATKEAGIDGKKVQLDLVFSHENLADNPEIHLETYDNEKKYILWWIDTGGHVPIEFQIATSSKNGIVGLGFTTGSGEFFFYEIDVKESLHEAKNANLRVARSAWIRDDSDSYRTNDLRQETIPCNFPNTIGDEVVWAGNLKLHEENGQWIVSFDAKRLHHLSETTYYFQYPVGGTGLTFLKKVRWHLDAKDIEWRIGLGSAFLIIGGITLFFVRKRIRQKAPPQPNREAVV
jgi:hypothetical protein